jgi:hypothetical protein
LTTHYKVFHFLELDWLLYFPVEGNRGEYFGYTILLNERKRKQKSQQNAVTLGSVLERVELDEHYPHTVGFSKAAPDDEANEELTYMEIRTIHNTHEFCLFLNALDL